MTDQAQGSLPPLSMHELVASGTTTQKLVQPVACFPNRHDALPNAELVLDFAELYNLVIADGRPRIYREKEAIPMVLCATLKVGPYTGRTAERFPGESGKQRSANHIEAYGPTIMFDIDSVPVMPLGEELRAQGIGRINYTSPNSDEEERDGKTGEVLKAKGRGRVLLVLDGTWSADEHREICRVINRYLLGG